MAGRPGAVTVATNMAGRGTDIMLGGNAEFMAVAAMASAGLDPNEDPEAYEAAWPEELKRAEDAVRRTARRSSRSAGSTSSAPSATSPAASTTSCGAGRAARATPARAASTSP